MKFKVEFSTGLNNKTSPFDHFNPGKGLDYVQAIRELSLMPEAPLDVIEANTTCSILTSKSAIEVFVKDEDDIDKINGFDVARKSKVIVPAGFLGQFVYMTVDIKRQSPNGASCEAMDKWEEDPENHAPDSDDFGYKIQKMFWSMRRNKVGQRAREMCRSLPEDRRKIIQISNGWDVDKALMYSTWRDAGFPIYWGISEDVFEKHKEERRKILIQLKAEEKKAKKKEEEERLKSKKLCVDNIIADLGTIKDRLKKVMENK